MPRPRDRLLNRHLGDWHVSQRITTHSADARPSTGYVAIHIHTNKQAYLRAVDLHDAYAIAERNGTDFFLEALHLLETHKHQWDLLELCKSQRLTRVVSAFHYQDITLDESDPIGSRVGYFLFEYADADVGQVISSRGFEHAWNLRLLKDVAAALSQLHRAGIAHQSIKASNILLYRPGSVSSSTHNTRLGDLAAATKRHTSTSSRSQAPLLGIAHQPIEALYGHPINTWNDKLSTDIYMLGNFATSLLTGTTMTQLLEDYVASEAHWMHWRGTYPEVLPELQAAHAYAMSEIRPNLEPSIRDLTLEILSGLSNPDPRQRGWRQGTSRRYGQYDLQPYVSALSNLAYQAGHGFFYEGHA